MIPLHTFGDDLVNDQIGQRTTSLTVSLWEQ